MPNLPVRKCPMCGSAPTVKHLTITDAVAVYCATCEFGINTADHPFLEPMFSGHTRNAAVRAWYEASKELE